MQSGVKIEVVPEFQEASALPCDTGSPREVLEKEEAFKGLDFSRLGEDWDSKVMLCGFSLVRGGVRY